MKITESAKIALQYCIIDFNKEKVWLMSNVMNIKRQTSYTYFLKILAPKFQRAGIAFLSLIFMTFDINQTFSLLKSMMQYCRAIFADSVIFVVKKGM